MSHDLVHLHRPTSPASSGRSSPGSFKVRLAAENGVNKKDKNYRRYASAVERALSLFDSALQDWADYIPFLGRLQKALQYRPTTVAEIPHKHLVTKRLAQCLNPALPNGVHQKAIDVYSSIFSILGTDGLAKDLPIYLSGLSSTLTFASLSIKPALLSLFEDSILPLDSVILRPALKAIILSLLPGLEEETSEEFERVHDILNRFKFAVGNAHERDRNEEKLSSEQYFWQCLFLASITSTSRRQGTLVYLTRNLPPLGKSEDQDQPSDSDVQSETAIAAEAVISPEPGLLIRCFATGLRDEHLLIQRGFLDLLVSHLPLHSPVLQSRVSSRDIESLVAAASFVTARREMSLNRRLWTWFLGPEVSAASYDSVSETTTLELSNDKFGSICNTYPPHSQYFRKYSMSPLVQSIRTMIETGSVAPSEKARPFRICLSLMDRWDIGGILVPEIFLPLLESVWLYQRTAPSQEAFDEVHRSASVFFDGVESGLVWGQIIKTIVTSLSEETALETAQSRMELLSFLVTRFNMQEEEMQLLHIPLASLVLVICLRESMERSYEPPAGNLEDLHSGALRVAMHLQDLVPMRAYSQEELNNHQAILKEDDESLVLANQQYLDSVRRYYERNSDNPQQSTPVLSSANIGRLLLDNMFRMVLRELQANARISYIELELGLFDRVVRKTPASELLDFEDVLMTFTQAPAKMSDMADKFLPGTAVWPITCALESLCSALPPESWASSYKLRQLLPDLVQRLWSGLSPSMPDCNVESARCIWRLHLISPYSQLVEGTVVSLLTTRTDTREHVDNIEIENARCFATLWAHSTTPVCSGSGALKLRSAHRARQKSEVRREAMTTQILLLGRPLLALLDSLRDPRTQLFIFVTNWLQSLPNTQLIVDFVMHRLKSSSCLSPDTGGDSTEGVSTFPRATPDLEECLYYLQTVENLITFSPNSIWVSLTTSVSASVEYSKARKGADKSGRNTVTSQNHEFTMHEELARICLSILDERHEIESGTPPASTLRQAATKVLRQMLHRPHLASILQIDAADAIIKALRQAVGQSDTVLQVSLMDLVVAVLRARLVAVPKAIVQPSHPSITSGEISRSSPRLSFSSEGNEKEMFSTDSPTPPPTLLGCLLLGLSSPNAQPVLESWVQFLDDCLPFFAGTAFQILMPLVDCFIKTIRSDFEILRRTFEVAAETPRLSEPLNTLLSLLNGLERALARAHERLEQHEAGTLSLKAPEQPQGFFGTMVSGVFPPELNKTRSATANNRLAVLLCFKDAVNISHEIWDWCDHELGLSFMHTPANSCSFNYISIRLKNRLRRTLEHLFRAEPLECLETLVQLWLRPDLENRKEPPTTILNLLHALDGSRPKYTIPAIFNAMYSRTNPNALDASRKSSLTTDLSDVGVAGFLIAYMQSLEDDAMDEIWSDCMTFLRDVLGNPLPHRQSLPRLVEFTAILGQKIDNTNFGEQRGMRRDLGDLFVRLLAATFTIKPLSFPIEPPPFAGTSKLGADAPKNVNSSILSNDNDIVTIISRAIPKILKILTDTDRMATAYSTISAQVLIPTIRSRTYPYNVTASTLDIFQTMSRVPEASKAWRKDVAEAFNDARFFSTSLLPLVEEGWIPVLRQWSLVDKDRVPELLSRISSPTSAGIVFGVGASSARSEADRKTQLNLRRLALLILAGADDSIIADLNVVYEKLSELLSATAASSPSSATRAEIYMLIRALLLKTSSIQLVPFWPTINSELYEVISSLFSSEKIKAHSIHGVLHACKLLDTLLVLAPEDFQPQEWAFITDTVDAIYRPSTWEPIALIDDLAESLDVGAGGHHSIPTPTISGAAQTGKRKPVLSSSTAQDVPSENILDRILRPFFRQLSINVFESTYSMEAPDWRACYDILLRDLFDDSSIA